MHKIGFVLFITLSCGNLRDLPALLQDRCLSEMSVHYKFKSALEYDTVTFDGLHISVRDLKNAIVQQKRIGKNSDFDLQITNAQTKEGE